MRKTNKKSVSIAIINTVAKEVRRYLDKQSKKHHSAFTDLRGFCAKASIMLFNRLSRRGLKPQIMHALYDKDSDYSACHYYVICNGHLVDVTATQFMNNHPRIMIQKLSDDEFPNWYHQGIPVSLPKAIGGSKHWYYPYSFRGPGCNNFTV